MTFPVLLSYICTISYTKKYMCIFYSYRWCTVTSTFLMYKTIDIVIVNVCRILLCIFQTVGRSVSKLLFLLHCLTWLVDVIFPIYLQLIYHDTNNLFSGSICTYIMCLHLCFGQKKLNMQERNLVCGYGLRQNA